MDRHRAHSMRSDITVAVNDRQRGPARTPGKLNQLEVKARARGIATPTLAGDVIGAGARLDADDRWEPAPLIP